MTHWFVLEPSGSGTELTKGYQVKRSSFFTKVITPLIPLLVPRGLDHDLAEIKKGVSQGLDWSDRLVTMRSMNASEFKAKCLAILDEVAATGEEITILKRGKPVVRLIAARRERGSYPQDTLKGTVHIHGDIMGPVVDPSDWEANRTG